MSCHPLCLAYYCSGHGYGHATRVSAFTRHLLSLPPSRRPEVYIVSSAPELVFADSIACGARYRFAEIDPVIVQPLAYRVDREKSVQVLRRFLEKKDVLLKRERDWLVEIGAHCVLSDAAFLGCLAARYASLPSILITNFSFDSVYSFLSTPLLDVPPSLAPAPTLSSSPSLTPTSLTHPHDDLPPDAPIPPTILAPLLLPLTQGYRSADLLIRLPGYIPIPSFFTEPALPAAGWVDVESRRMKAEVVEGLDVELGLPWEAGKGERGGKGVEMLPRIELPELDASSPPSESDITSVPDITPDPDSPTSRSASPRTRPARTPSHALPPRQAWQSPLIVRPPSSPSVYTPQGRADLLKSIGVPESVARDKETKVLVVSFGGQVVRRPQGGSRVGSRAGSEEDVTRGGKGSGHANGHTSANGHTNANGHGHTHAPRAAHTAHTTTLHAPRAAASSSLPTSLNAPSSSPSPPPSTLTLSSATLTIPTPSTSDLATATTTTNANTSSANGAHIPQRLSTPNHIYIPGAPPVVKSGLVTSPTSPTAPAQTTGPASFAAARDGVQRAVSERERAAQQVDLVAQQQQETQDSGQTGPSIRMVPPTPKATASTTFDFSTAHAYAKGAFYVGAAADGHETTASDSSEVSDEYYTDEDYSTEDDYEDLDTLLPDPSWIAIVCGVNKAAWNSDEEDDLPEGFYVAPREVYMPDLTAVGDVLLGKLGYGTVSECVDACTPFVYVSRPLFIEEHGLRRLLDSEGVGVELSREGYEGGRWAAAIREAWERGRGAKEARRGKVMWELEAVGREGRGEGLVDGRQEEGRRLAGEVVGWVEDWWR